MSGVILFNPNNQPVRTPRGYIGGGEWAFFETRHDLTEYIAKGDLVEVEPPGRGDPLGEGTVDAVLAYYAHQDAEQAAQAQETVTEPVESPQSTSKRTKGRVRDTDSASNDTTTEGEA